MIIDCISDLHGYRPKLEGGDLLIIAGDHTARDSENEVALFDYWLNEQPYRKKIVIAGNHDGVLEQQRIKLQFCDYLCDSSTEFEGLKIWGSPWSPTFCNWHFMKDRGEDIRKMWELIPQDTDILITHCPPYGVLDKTIISSRGNQFQLAGCEELRSMIDSGRICPKLHVFGHIHEEGGKQVIFKQQDNNIICVNASIMDINYNPTNKPIRIVL